MKKSPFTNAAPSPMWMPKRSSSFQQILPTSSSKRTEETASTLHHHLLVKSNKLPLKRKPSKSCAQRRATALARSSTLLSNAIISTCPALYRPSMTFTSKCSNHSDSSSNWAYALLPTLRLCRRNRQTRRSIGLAALECSFSPLMISLS